MAVMSIASNFNPIYILIKIIWHFDKIKKTCLNLPVGFVVNGIRWFRAMAATLLSSDL